jgi:hypothetical protein
VQVLPLPILHALLSACLPADLTELRHGVNGAGVIDFPEFLRMFRNELLDLKVGCQWWTDGC